MSTLLQPQQLAMEESGAEMGEEGSLSGLYSATDSASVCNSSGDELELLQTSSEGYSTDTTRSFRQPPTSLHWVRMSALRIHDNPALNHAMQEPGTRFRAVFILDPWFATEKFGACRWRFLLESLQDIDKRLRTFNSRLFVAQGQPVAVLEKLSDEWNVTSITFQRSGEPRSRIVEEAVEKLADVKGIQVHKFSAHTLYSVSKVLAMNNDQPVTTFKEFKELLPLLGAPEPPVNSPELAITKLLTCEDDVQGNDYRIPTMAELGFPGESLYTNHWIGGESEALRKLPIYCQLRSRSSSNPVDLLFDKTSLSPYVRFGCLSVRYFLWKVKWCAKSNPALEHLVKEVTSKLLQREFYFTVAAQVPNFDCYCQNPICLQLPWEKDPCLFQLWKEGQTGYPWIDAAMRQLRKEGWIHHCLRESVATFLTRGDLWISWVQGKDTFEELMLDFEPSVSCGCWMRSSCSAFFTGPVEHYCPITFGQKIDPQGQYVRAYVPELQNFPSEYIYCPWTAPLSVQEASGCRIGVHYPNPVVDHGTAGALCCERLRSVMTMIHQASNVEQPSLATHHDHQYCVRSMKPAA